MSAPSPRTVAAIDIGSNSLQITVARVHDDSVEILDRVKETVRLAGVIDRSHSIPQAAIDNAIVLLSSFRDLAQKYDAELRVSATAAIRSARNAHDFVRQAREVAQTDVHVISPMDEARLVRQGVNFGMPNVSDTPTLCVDVGGGSTELSVGCGEHMQVVTSVPQGAINVTTQALGKDPVPSSRARRVRRALRARFKPSVSLIKGQHYEKVIATGGTIQRIARIVASLRGQPAHDVDGFLITREELRGVFHRLIGAQDQARRLKIPGMDPERADVLLGGAVVFETIGHLLSVEEWVVSMSALRTGLLTTSRWPL